MTDREMVERLMDYIVDQQETVEQLQEYIVALERSIRMRKAAVVLPLPPPA